MDFLQKIYTHFSGSFASVWFGSNLNKEKLKASCINFNVRMINLNRSYTLHHRFENITRQIHEQILFGEVLVIDDCSSDDSVNVIQKID